MSEVKYEIAADNGEKLHVAERETLRNLDTSVLPSAVQTLVQRLVSFVLRHSQFSLSYRVVWPRRSVVWILLLETRDGFQRVHLERVTCKHCEASVSIANPTLLDLYLNLSNQQEALEHAWAQPEVPCPQCGGRLPRRAIWAEVVDGEANIVAEPSVGVTSNS